MDEIEQMIEAAVANPDRSLAARAAFLSDMVDLLMAHQATAELLLSENHPLAHTDIGERARRVLQLARQGLMPARPTVEDRIRVSAALAIVQSTLDNLSDLSSALVRDLVVKLAVFALNSECKCMTPVGRAKCDLPRG